MKPVNSATRIYLWMGLLIAAALTAVGVSFYSGNQASKTYPPLVDAAMEIKLEAAIAHLWFEEILSGDRHEDIETVWHHIDQSVWYAKAMLEGGSNTEGTFIPLADAGLRRESEEVLQKLSEFRSVAEQRYAAREGSAAGSDMDEQFDAVFRDFMTQADHVETALQHLMNRERVRFIAMLSVLAVLCLALAALVVFVLRRERERVFSALQDVGQSEERLRLSTEVAGIAVWEYDVVNNRLSRSGNHDPLYGMEPQESSAFETFLEAMHPEDREHLQRITQESIAAGGPDRCNADFRAIWPDASVHWLSVYGEVAERNTEGFATLVRGTLLDITERKQAEEELRNNEQALADQKRRVDYILQGTNVGTWEWNVQSGEVIFNERWAEIVGYTLEELSPVSIETWTSLCHPDDLEESTRLLQQCFAGEQAYYNCEARMRHKNGDWVWVLDRGRVGSWTDDGQPLWMYGTHQDITDRKQAEENLRRDRTLLEFSLDSSESAAWYVDLVNQSSGRTPGHDRIFGYETRQPDWSHDRFLEHVLPEDRAEADRAFKAAIAAQGEWNFECRIRRTDGEVRWIWDVGRHGFFVEGKAQLVSGIIRDITERKEAEEELQRAHDLLESRVEERTAELKTRRDEAETLNRGMINLLQDLKESNLELEAAEQSLRATNSELEAFSYSVSHDLRAPLRHIDGFVQLLLQREQEHLDDTSARYLDTIAQSSLRMGRLIDDLLAFSRTGRIDMHPEPVDLNKIVQTVIHELSSQTEGRRMVWEIADLPSVQADSSLLQLAWQNLISNAVKYTAPRREARIEIGVTPEAGTDDTVFFIRDNGVGFDPHYKHKLFGVFQRLHREDEFEGTGIGLATVRRIVHRHGGKVWAEGEVEQGATFYFTLRETKGAD